MKVKASMENQGKSKGFQRKRWKSEDFNGEVKWRWRFPKKNNEQIKFQWKNQEKMVASKESNEKVKNSMEKKKWRFPKTHDKKWDFNGKIMKKWRFPKKRWKTDDFNGKLKWKWKLPKENDEKCDFKKWRESEGFQRMANILCFSGSMPCVLRQNEGAGSSKSDGKANENDDKASKNNNKKTNNYPGKRPQTVFWCYLCWK